MVDTSINLCGIALDNPIIPASGTFGYGYEFAELYDINCLGTFAFKGTTQLPRYGNAMPRIAECCGGMLNAVGLQNPGVDKVISEELPKLSKCFHKPVMANVSGFCVEEYVAVCEKLDTQPQVGWFEVNISCPNVHGGGMSFGTDAKMAASVTSAVRRVTKKPILIKLTPNVTDIAAIAKACADAGADGLSLINTVLAMRIDLKQRKPLLANGTGLTKGAKNLLKLYLNDVGLLTAQLFGNNIRAVLDDESSINLGAVYETVAATELKAHGHPLWYYDNRRMGEIDFLIDSYDTLSVLPIEIKSGKDYNIHSALSRFVTNSDYSIKQALVLSNKREIQTKGAICYMPVYNIMFL